MKAIDYHTNTEKSKWMDGPWKNEPDKMQFVDKDTGYPCLIVRHPSSGHLCGYVGVTDGHPAFKENYDSVKLDGDWLDVHGGLTFSDVCQDHKEESTGVCHVAEAGEAQTVWWLGFDCAHAYDLAPGHVSLMKGYGMGSHHDGDVYRTVLYVQDQCAKLAQQLKTIAKKGRMD